MSCCFRRRDSLASTDRPTNYTYLLACIACLNSANLGYDVGCVGGAAVLMREDLGWGAVQTEMFVSSANFMAILGAMQAPRLCDGIGRRRTFTVSCAIFVVGVLLVSLSQSFLVAMIGRVITGLGIGLGLAIDPLYISEIAPSKFRGRLVSLSELAINAGILLGMVADYVLLDLPPGVNWRMMMGLGLLLPTVLMVLTVTIMPESPRYLMATGRRAEAEAVLRRTLAPGTELGPVVEEIAEQIDRDAGVASRGWGPILRPTPAVRLMLLAGVGLGAMQQINGSEAFIYFSPELLESAGFTSRRSSFGIMVGIGLSKTLFILVGAGLVDTWGRRPLLFASTTAMALFLLLIALALPGGQHTGLAVFGMFAFVAAFSIGVGPVCWTGVSEVFPYHIRAKAMSLATMSNRLISALVTGTTLSLSDALGVRGFFIFYACLTLGSTLYLYRFFPETKGRSLEDMGRLFESLAGSSSSSSSSSSSHEFGSPIELTGIPALPLCDDKGHTSS